ncbi:putative membrane protein YqiK [Actinoalloteichus hoggarensis]|uniref:Inner membrane protein YqiK n=1 Tax=Actinoalloteichus hoggarensis TaxID=1470176 RepID=A0A221W8D7_9PSEU|nr:flotillin family protein [Actinoalloteichus hoggarensis]ASO22155.1 Inner membrane protein YqiK [Actinoalloteichus hoggarensis]MBB5923762.1 putative membrane protein YqiK [Actinoalloteichus hoggarensis]
MPEGILLVTVSVVAGILVFIVLLRLLWKVAEPNEALIISGLGTGSTPKSRPDSMGFKIITGKGTMVIPGFQVARRLSLDTNGANLQVSCVTQQGLPVTVRAVVIYKVGDDFVSIANAARRFLDRQDGMNSTIHELFSGHLRSICGGLTIEDLIHNRDALTGAVRQSSADEMSKLGLVIDSLQIQEIDDESGYILNLGKPHAAAVAASARIAEAERDQEATEAEQQAAAKKAASVRESEIQQAGYQAEMDEARARSSQSGPLAEASARQEVVVQETRAAELEANLSEQRLLSEVSKPADAKAYEMRTVADAERDARIAKAQAEAKETELRAAADATRVKTAAQAEAEATKARGSADAEATRATGEAEAAAARAKGMAEADAARAKGLAEAEGIRARAAALAENQEAVVAQQLAENWPEIVNAGAKAFSNVDNMVVLNGADGMSELFGKALSLGGTGLGLAKTLMQSMQHDGVAEKSTTQNGTVHTIPVERDEQPSQN